MPTTAWPQACQRRRRRLPRPLPLQATLRTELRALVVPRGGTLFLGDGVDEAAAPLVNLLLAHLLLTPPLREARGSPVARAELFPHGPQEPPHGKAWPPAWTSSKSTTGADGCVPPPRLQGKRDEVAPLQAPLALDVVERHRPQVLQALRVALGQPQCRASMTASRRWYRSWDGRRPIGPVASWKSRASRPCPSVNQ